MPKKTTLYLNPEKMKALKILAVETEKTMTALVEEAITEYIAKRTKTDFHNEKS